MDKAYFNLVREAQAKGEPVAVYTKGIVGKVGISMIDPLTGNPVETILVGTPGEDDPEDFTVTLWTPFEHEYFRRANKELLRTGYLIPAPVLEKEIVSINEISDKELRKILGEKFFSLKAFLDKVTSEIPVLRALRIAEEMNKPVGTIEAITKRLSELQQRGEAEE